MKREPPPNEGNERDEGETLTALISTNKPYRSLLEHLLSSSFCPHFSACSPFSETRIRQKDGGRKMGRGGIGTEANEGHEGEH